jgi:hypothetical protein
MPLLTITEQQREAERRRAEELAAGDRMRRREKVIVLLICVAWNVAGVAIMARAMASLDPDVSAALWALGPFVGYGGMGLTLLGYVVYLTEQGDL